MGTCCSTEANDSSTPKRCHEHQLPRDISATLKEAPPSTSKSFVYPTMPSIKAGSLGDPSDQSPVSDARINSTFDKYKERHEDLILSDGILRMCQDLKVNADDFAILLFAWKCDAQQMCRFSRDEFLIGMRRLKVESLKQLHARLPELVREVDTHPEQFKEMYRFAYRFALDSEIGQRILSTEMAVQLWKVVFARREIPFLERWLSFVTKQVGLRGIPKDTWIMFLHFVDTVQPNFSDYSAEEAWPSLIDDFVESEKEQKLEDLEQ